MLRRFLALASLTAVLSGMACAQDSAPQLLSRTGGKGSIAGWSNLAQLKKAADAGDSKACAQLGEMYVAGTGGVQRDLPRALPLLERAARTGVATAAFRLAMLLDNGDGVTLDQGRARAYFRAAAAGGSGLAYYNIGANLASGRGQPRDYAEALAWLMLASRHGAPGDTESRLRAFILEANHQDWIARAEARSVEIEHELAAQPMTTFLPPPAPLVALKASPSPTSRPPARTPGLPRSADRPRPVRQMPELPAPAPTPRPLPPPPVPVAEKPSGPPLVVVSIAGRALEWTTLESLERDARNNVPNALFALGQLLIDGEKVPADPDRALMLLERGAALGNVDAAYRLADLYTHGRLVVFDEKRGFEYMLMAARGGARTAIYNMGALYANGRGTPQNYTEALAWFTVAEKYGADFGAATKIRDYLNRTAPAQVAIAEHRAAELQREIDAARQKNS